MAYFIFFASVLFTIILHELAHLTAAVLCKVKVDAFCVGFFKPYFHKTWKGIDWRITPFLLGGYCLLHGENEKVPNGFLIQPYHKKLAIAFAGVFANLIIAIICYLINYQNIFVGFYLDWVAIQSVFTNNYDELIKLTLFFKPNFFLFQLSMLNFFCFLSNIAPIPALDGSYIFLPWMEYIWKENYVKYLNILTKTFFILLMVVQAIFILWMWLK